MIGPVETFDKAGSEIDFATPKGKRSHALPPSMDEAYIDPPLGRGVTSAEVAQKVRDFDAGKRLDDPLNLDTMVAEQPYFSSHNYVREMEAYYAALDKLAEELDATYDALLPVGGSGPIVDMVNNQRVHDPILIFKASPAWPSRGTWTIARASSGANT
jgi:putative intracellular protease/amidase